MLIECRVFLPLHTYLLMSHVSRRHRRGAVQLQAKGGLSLQWDHRRPS